MITSLQDAQLVLAKWSNEQIPLAVICSVDSLHVAMDRGLIKSLTDRRLDLGNYGVDISIPLGDSDEGFSYVYKQPKQTPGGIMGDLSRQYAGSLKIKTAGFDCLIYELIGPEP